MIINLKIVRVSSKLYNLYLSNKLPSSVKDRCCNFKLLEQKCDEYFK